MILTPHGASVLIYPLLFSDGAGSIGSRVARLSSKAQGMHVFNQSDFESASTLSCHRTADSFASCAHHMGLVSKLGPASPMVGIIICLISKSLCGLILKHTHIILIHHEKSNWTSLSQACENFEIEK